MQADLDAELPRRQGNFGKLLSRGISQPTDLTRKMHWVDFPWNKPRLEMSNTIPMQQKRTVLHVLVGCVHAPPIAPLRTDREEQEDEEETQARSFNGKSKRAIGRSVFDNINELNLRLNWNCPTRQELSVSVLQLMNSGVHSLFVMSDGSKKICQTSKSKRITSICILIRISRILDSEKKSSANWMQKLRREEGTWTGAESSTSSGT